VTGGQAALGALVAAALAGCAAPIPKKVDFSEGRRGFDSSKYEQVLATWTRHSKVVELDIGTVIEMWAVFKSPEFREAYVERYAAVYNLPPAERQSLYNAQMEAAKNGYEFHVAVQTTDWKWNDLEKGTSPWKVSLLDGNGAEVAPKKIDVPRLPELYEARFFPSKTEFSRTYLIRFDRADAEAAGFSGPQTGRLILRVVSPMAHPELTWQAK
jgi:hypothetical protein